MGRAECKDVFALSTTVVAKCTDYNPTDSDTPTYTSGDQCAGISDDNQKEETFDRVMTALFVFHGLFVIAICIAQGCSKGSLYAGQPVEEQEVIFKRTFYMFAILCLALTTLWISAFTLLGQLAMDDAGESEIELYGTLTGP